MKYFLNDTWVNDSTIKVLPTGATLLSDTEWDARQNVPYVKTAEDIQRETNAEARQYLASTDWLLMRELDGGIVMDAETKQLRAEARARVI